MVVMRPLLMPKVSWSTRAMGERQLVVQEAADRILCSGLRAWLFTPGTMVTSMASFEGADRNTLRAPALRWFSNSARAVKRPVDSITYSTFRSRQGSSAGDLTCRILTGF